MAAIREKKHRLAKKLYSGYAAVSYTKCIKNRKNFFITNDVFDIFESVLLELLMQYQCEAHIYLFMPDHVHFLIQGKSGKADSLQVMYKFAQKTGFWLARNCSHIKWQKDFYDHILRNDDDLKKVIEYILLNPVRKKIVTDWKNYPFKGSTLYNFDEW